MDKTLVFFKLFGYSFALLVEMFIFAKSSIVKP